MTGSIQKPGDYTLAQIQALPKVMQNTRHVCVEGWDVIGNFEGVRISDFLKTIGADGTASYNPLQKHAYTWAVQISALLLLYSALRSSLSSLEH